MTTARERLIQDLVDQREAVLQACWAQQVWNPGRLATADGQPLQVIFPGWINRGPGPDFTQARRTSDHSLRHPAWQGRAAARLGRAARPP